MKLIISDLERCNKLNNWCWCTACFSDKVPKTLHGHIARNINMDTHKEYYNSLGFVAYDNDVYIVSSMIKKRVRNIKYQY